VIHGTSTVERTILILFCVMCVSLLSFQLIMKLVQRPGMLSCLKTARKKMVLGNKMKNMREKLEKINKERQNFTFAPTSGASQDQQLYDEREARSDVKEAEILGRGGEEKDITELLSSSHSKDTTCSCAAGQHADQVDYRLSQGEPQQTMQHRRRHGRHLGGFYGMGWGRPPFFCSRLNF
jgi:hypothetical protein